jgi:RecT family
VSLARIPDGGRLDLIRDQLAPGSSDDELAWFGAVADRLELDPFAGHIVLIGRYDGKAKRDVYRPQITVAGRRTIASRTGELVGIEGPVWCGPRNDAGELVWRDVWDDDGYPYAARALVYRRGWERPANGTAKWSEFAQYGKADNDGEKRPLQTWRQMPSHMLGKVAESMALRRAFPEIAAATAGLAGDDDVVVMAEASAPEIPASAGTRQARPSTTGAGPDAVAPGSRRPVERRRRPDDVPIELYDNLPEAQG